MNRVDEILEIIDTGLQTAGDTAYGNDWPGTCWRCGEAADDLCAGCRDWLHAEVAADAEITKSVVPQFCWTVSVDGFFCTLGDSHDGDHEAHGPGGRLIHHWPQANADPLGLDRLAPWQRRIIAECAEIDHTNARSNTQ